jgi:hypothetical protein
VRETETEREVGKRNRKEEERGRIRRNLFIVHNKKWALACTRARHGLRVVFYMFSSVSCMEEQ